MLRVEAGETVLDHLPVVIVLVQIIGGSLACGCIRFTWMPAKHFLSLGAELGAYGRSG